MIRLLLFPAMLVCFAYSSAESSTRCLTRAFEPYRAQALANAQLIPPELLGNPTREPPPNPQVGDEWIWYIWDLSGMPVANELPCTVRGMGGQVDSRTGYDFVVL